MSPSTIVYVFHISFKQAFVPERIESACMQGPAFPRCKQGLYFSRYQGLRSRILKHNPAYVDSLDSQGMRTAMCRARSDGQRIDSKITETDGGECSRLGQRVPKNTGQLAWRAGHVACRFRSRDCSTTGRARWCQFVLPYSPLQHFLLKSAINSIPFPAFRNVGG